MCADRAPPTRWRCRFLDRWRCTWACWGRTRFEQKFFCFCATFHAIAPPTVNSSTSGLFRWRAHKSKNLGKFYYTRLQIIGRIYRNLHEQISKRKKKKINKLCYINKLVCRKVRCVILAVCFSCFRFLRTSPVQSLYSPGQRTLGR